MMKIKADLHTHTVLSFDGRQTIEQLTGAAKTKGLQAVAVTDHGVYSPLPEQMNGVLLIPGCEYFTTAGHITGLFLEQPPRVKTTVQNRVPPNIAVEDIHNCGGIAVLAHPFENPGRTEAELDFQIDAIETANARGDHKIKGANQKAVVYAQQRKLPPIGGSDAHSASEVANAYTEIECAECTRAALKQAITEGQCTAVLLKNTPRRMIGLSQFKRRRGMGGLKNLMIGIAFLCKCVYRDIFERKM